MSDPTLTHSILALERVKPKSKAGMEDVKKQMTMWGFISLEDYARQLDRTEKEIFFPYAWDILDYPKEFDGAGGSSLGE